MLVDTHLHLDMEQFDADRDTVVEHARQAGVSGFVLVGFEERRWPTTEALCERFPGMVRAAGVHPNSATTWHDGTAEALEAELAKPGVVALGEIGLDFFRDDVAPETQREVFERQLELARRLDVPVIIHQRSAEIEVVETIERCAPLRGVMHCFTGDAAFAERCLALGFYLGLGGVLTFPRSDALRDAIRQAPEDRLLLETDAPFIAPQPWRGQRNEPAYVAAVAEQLAELRGCSVADIAERTTRNALALFGPSLASTLPETVRMSV